MIHFFSMFSPKAPTLVKVMCVFFTSLPIRGRTITTNGDVPLKIKEGERLDIKDHKGGVCVL